MTKPINFTKTTLNNLTSKTQDKRTYYKDATIKGLALAVQPSGAKSFYVVKKIAGKSVKFYLGKYPDLSIENARKLATVILGEIAMGRNPVADKQQQTEELTFGELFEQYMTRHSKPHKVTWLSDEQGIKRLCGHWFDRKLSTISRDDVMRLQETVSETKGRYMANSIIRKIRAIYNKAIEWGWHGNNPAKSIKKYREHSRDRFLQPVELPHMIAAIKAEPYETVSDYFMLLLFTGVRKTNARLMRWEQINWTFAEWRIPVTKNGEPVIVPLTDEAMTLLRKRQEASTSPFVFPGAVNADKPLGCVNHNWKAIKERATQSLQQATANNTASVMDVRIHDLRRTFGSYQAMSGASLTVIGKSLGHKSTQATQIYARLNLDAVRESVMKATAAMLALR